MGEQIKEVENGKEEAVVKLFADECVAYRIYLLLCGAVRGRVSERERLSMF